MTAPLLLLHLVSPSAMGFGDVKLAVVLGAAVGVLDWQLAVPALALAAGATATVGVVTRARTIPFGPGLLAGALVATLANDLLVTVTST
jgi:leader peptidase (prepilin peptidase)/N-methyltransferase